MNLNKSTGLLFFLMLFSVHQIKAQYDYQPVFRGFTGDSLFVKLVDFYKPDTLLDYSKARDTLYANIDNQNDTVYCIYSGYGLYLPGNVDPTEYLYYGGGQNGINAEHTYPVSKGTEYGLAKSDLHHIFPSKININSDRASYEFNEIKDNITQKWYLKDKIQSNIPGSNIDAYSEYANQYFEPRESKKGDIARALFYIKTMYKDQTELADPNFFSNQVDTLCKWHFQDPVDSMEWERTWKIAAYQDDKPNPYVLDCSLAHRTYCDFITDQCLKVGINEMSEGRKISVILSPIPVIDNLNVSIDNYGTQFLEIIIFSIVGNPCYNLKIFTKGDPNTEINFPMQNMPEGVYIMEVRGITDKIISRVLKKIIKI